MPKLAYQGGEINYEVAGEGHPLIFVSGLNGVARYWQAQVSVFAKRYKVVTYDQRGTGGSDRLQKDFSVDQMARELAALGRHGILSVEEQEAAAARSIFWPCSSVPV